ncbi:MAG: hypothetical protein AAFP79_02735 [Pseudomonadota bacterium]
MVTEPPQDSGDEQNAPKSEQFPYGEILREIRIEWNKAEAAIKRAEQLVGDIHIPAVFELRYGGRRMIDALDAAHHGGDPKKILALLEDARFCCHRAQHDAIDAAMSKMSITLDNMTSRLGFDAVASAHPDFNAFYSDFMVAREKIAQSRENRKDRNGIYEALTAVDLPNLTERFTRLMAAEPIAKNAALKIKLGSLNGFVLTVVAILAMIFAGLAVDWDAYLGETSTDSQLPAEANSQ